MNLLNYLDPEKQYLVTELLDLFGTDIFMRLVKNGEIFKVGMYYRVTP